MKGIEGLPLKYIVLIIVAAIVVGVVVQVTNMLSSTAKEGAEKTTESVDSIVDSQNENACIESNSTGNLVWNSSSNICETKN